MRPKIEQVPKQTWREWWTTPFPPWSTWPWQNKVKFVGYYLVGYVLLKWLIS